jgi:hypothetical protein
VSYKLGSSRFPPPKEESAHSAPRGLLKATLTLCRSKLRSIVALMFLMPNLSMRVTCSSVALSWTNSVSGYRAASST